MKVKRVYTRNVVATTGGASIAQAAEAMREFGVGCLLVVEDTDGASRPIGIVTDRDLAVAAFTASDVAAAMTPVIATVRENADVHEALELMRAHGVRRLAVTRDGGEIVGVVSIDDIVDGLAAELAAAAAVLKGPPRVEIGEESPEVALADGSAV